MALLEGPDPPAPRADLQDHSAEAIQTASPCGCSRGWISHGGVPRLIGIDFLYGQPGDAASVPPWLMFSSCSKNSAKHTSHVPRITVAMPRHSGQSVTTSDGLIADARYDFVVTRRKRECDGMVNLTRTKLTR
jgi:hypothetical protein